MPTLMTLQVQEREMNDAALALETSLKTRWPVGSPVKVFLSCKQIEPSPATVVNHWGSRAVVRVRLDKPNKWGRQHVADVHYSKISNL